MLAFGVGSRPRQIDPSWQLDTTGVLTGVRKELDEYFAGRLRKFTTPLAFEGTPFQNQVWKELTRIPYGETISYLELANRIKNPKAVRAVGMANGANPIAIIVPCHRVIGSNGSLTGFRRRPPDQARAAGARARPADAAVSSTMPHSETQKLRNTELWRFKKRFCASVFLCFRVMNLERFQFVTRR